MSSSNNVEHAILYARRGWPVLPLHSIKAGVCTCGNRECGSAGKHPRTRHGHKDATIEETVIRQWWSKYPDANIGIVTGKASGLVVVDIDPRNGGDVSFTELCEGYEVPNTLCAKTGGGGRHLVFSYPDDIEKVKGRSNALGDGVDVKADGGYIVAAPSVHYCGECYEWVDGDAFVTPMPEWLRNLIIAPEKKGDKGRYDEVTEGKRNDYLASVAGKYKKSGVANGDMYRLLQEENQMQCQPPLCDDEVRRIALSVSRYDDRPLKFRWIELISDPDTPIHATTHHVLMTLSKWMNSEGRNCYPTIEQIAEASRRTRKTVGDHLKLAEDAKLIRRYRVAPKDKGGGRNWNYGYLAVIPYDV